MKRLKYILFVALTACTAKEPLVNSQLEIRGIEAWIAGGEEPETRAGTVTKLTDYVGRSKFKGGDRAVFTNIRRTSHPILEFTYPGIGQYEGVVFEAGASGGWTRAKDSAGPERIYWTDAVSPHTFVAYALPQTSDYDWRAVEMTIGTEDVTYYVGSLGNPSEAGAVDYRGGNELIEKEDVLICHDLNVKAQPGGSVALVKFGHAMSSVRVVVDINGFSAGASAVDNRTVVSNMRLLNQPTLYIWQQSNSIVRALREGDPYYDEACSKDVVLWIPNPDGVGDKQAKTFTFYGITTPQPENYGKTQLSFDVTYPDPLDPSVDKTHTYTATLQDVFFESGYNTTLNISLNHLNEQMTVGAEYEDWQFVSTPDQSQLKKNSTFLHDTKRASVTIAADAQATPDDATWLYREGDKLLDIYDHDGSEAHPFQISTAYQLLSFAYEVQSGRSFEGQYVSLDADITFEVPWIGIGDAGHVFNGTFLGGRRFVYGVKGMPLFYGLGARAVVEQLQVSTDGAVSLGGIFAGVNEGLLSGCRAVGDVELEGACAGAFVAENKGIIYASYHVGDTQGASAVGGLVGLNTGTLVGCYHAGHVYGASVQGIAASNTGNIETCFFNKTLLPLDDPNGYTTTQMIKQPFTDLLNDGLAAWRTAHPTFSPHHYLYQPANYPKLNE